MRWLGLFLIALASFCCAEDSVFYAGFETLEQWGCHPVRNNLAVSFAPPAGGTDLRLRMAIQDLPARKGEALIGALIGQGGTPPYAYALTNGTLPTGISLDPSTGALSGTPTVVGRSQFIAEVQDAALGVYQCRFAIDIIPNLAIVAGDPHDGEQTTDYSYQFSISGATGAVTWSVNAGSIPSSYSLDSATGILSGNVTLITLPTVYDFTIRATDGGSGDHIDIPCQISIIAKPSKTPSSISFYDNVPGSQSFQFSGGLAPYILTLNFSVVDSWANYTFDQNSGLLTISGTAPAQAAPSVAFLPTYTLVDALGGTISGSLSINVFTRQTIIQPQLFTSDVGPVGPYRFNFEGTGISSVTNDGTTVTITVDGGSSLTGDGATTHIDSAGVISALSAPKLTTARSISMTGDVAWTVSFDGSGNVTATGTLAAAQPAVHTWALAQTFTVAPIFTDQSGSRTALGLGTVATLASDTDGTLAANSDLRVATQKAVKAYVDAHGVTITLAPVGSTPNANAATIAGSTLNLQPADSTYPGVMCAADYGALQALKHAMFGGI